MKRTICLAILLAGGCLLCGCGQKREETEPTVLPEYMQLMEEAPEPIVFSDNGDHYPAVSFYVDNTGSMERFVYTEEGKYEVDPMYVHFMRSLRDLGRIYDSTYYVIQEENQTADGEKKKVRVWKEYEGSVFDNFTTKEFYYSWRKDGYDDINGPLSKLYFEDQSMDNDCINVVLTDLAEQNVNNTQLAEEIQKLCENHQCEAYLFAFKFQYIGNAEVPNPGMVSTTIKGRVDGPRPYYVIVTGPKNYMGQFIKNMKEGLKAEQLIEGVNYYSADNHIELNQSVLSADEVIVVPTADYEQAKEEIKTGITKLSRNVVRNENPDNWFSDGGQRELLAFQYEKTKGIPKKNSEWWLDMYFPLNDSQNQDISYECRVRTFHVEEPESDKDAAEGESADETDETIDENADGIEETAPEENWVEETVPSVTAKVELVTEYPEQQEESPMAYHMKLTGAGGKDAPYEQTLAIVTIMRSEARTYEVPAWVQEFDTGTSDDYFQRTYNLEVFYDVLFGYKHKRLEDGTMVFQSKYAEIPVIITDIK